MGGGLDLAAGADLQGPEATADHEIDCPAYGRLGLSGGIICDIAEPRPDRRVACTASVTGDAGRVFISQPRPVLIQGLGAEASPVYPGFFDTPGKDTFTLTIERLIEAAATGAADVPCNGADYLHVLEVAIAMTLSATRGNERVHLPLEDRSLRLFPHPYRMHGGDVAGWQSIGYQGPPSVA